MEMWIYFLVIILFCFAIFNIISAQFRKIREIDTKLNAIIKHLEIKYSPYDNLPVEIDEALKANKRIKAIKIYRKFTGAGLKEAKEFIDKYQARDTH